MKKSSLILALIFTIRIIYSQDNNNASQSGMMDMLKLKTLIQENNLNFAKGVSKSDVSAFGDLYLENAKFLPPGEDFITGNSQIRKWWDVYLKSGIHSMSINMVSLAGDGDVLYETGQISREIWKDNKASMQYDKYVTVWRLQDDGSYKIVLNMWNTDKKVE